MNPKHEPPRNVCSPALEIHISPQTCVAEMRTFLDGYLLQLLGAQLNETPVDPAHILFSTLTET